VYKIAVYGAGGFGREVAMMLNEIRHLNPSDHRVFEGFVDDFIVPDRVAVLENVSDVVIAVANPILRKKIAKQMKRFSFDFVPVVHPSVYINESNKIGSGSVICAGTKITCGVVIGEFNIINLNSVIGHDVTTGSYCSIMPSANILGGVTLGNGVFVGTGAIIFQNVKVGTGAIIGAGSVVTKDITAGQKVMGVPARVR